MKHAELMFDELNEYMGLLAGFYISPRDTSTSILLLAYLLKYISPIMLYENLKYNSISQSALQKRFEKLVKENKLKSYTLPNLVRGAKKVYTITRKGMKELYELTEGRIVPRKVSPENSVLKHNYLCACALLSLLLECRNDSYISTEDSYYLDNNKNPYGDRTHTVRPDGTFKCIDGTLFLEVDTGTESLPVFINKLFRYFYLDYLAQQMSLFNEGTSIVVIFNKTTHLELPVTKDSCNELFELWEHYDSLIGNMSSFYDFVTVLGDIYSMIDTYQRLDMSCFDEQLSEKQHVSMYEAICNRYELRQERKLRKAEYNRKARNKVLQLEQKEVLAIGSQESADKSVNMVSAASLRTDVLSSDDYSSSDIPSGDMNFFINEIKKETDNLEEFFINNNDLGDIDE